MGRPEKKLDLSAVEDLAARGLSLAQISICLGIDKSTIYRKKRDNAKVAEALERGRERGIAFAASQLQSLIEQGNLGAIIFYLKARGNWSEKQVIEHKDITSEQEAAKALTTEQLLEIMRDK